MDVFKRYVSTALSVLAPYFVPARRAWTLTFIGALLIFYFTFSPFTAVSTKNTVSIARGTSVSRVAEELAAAHIVAHPGLLEFMLRITGVSTRVQAGTYLFDTPNNLFVVAYRLVAGAYGLPAVRMTFPEGITVREMADQVTAAFPGITQKEFLDEAQLYEGYLFPDTYFFPPSSDATSIVASMRANFDTKIQTIADEISISGRSLSDTVTLASLVEKEARTTVDRGIVAGILINRLKLGMPLQVDAVFGYIYNRDTYSPSLADLSVNSPYNTYLHTGLPPGPIDNPGLDSLQAAAHPTKTNYLYYLTGKDGLMHYATTYAGHQANRKKYLDI